MKKMRIESKNKSCTPKPTEIPLSAVCSNCGYFLRGLPEARCPECGTSFDFSDPAILGIGPKSRYVSFFLRIIGILLNVLAAAVFAFIGFLGSEADIGVSEQRLYLIWGLGLSTGTALSAIALILSTSTKLQSIIRVVGYFVGGLLIAIAILAWVDVPPPWEFLAIPLQLEPPVETSVPLIVGVTNIAALYVSRTRKGRNTDAGLSPPIN